MPVQDPMAKLYGRLGSIGFPRKYLREVVLPDWWDDQIAHNPAGYAEGMLHLSKNLGLDLASLQNDAVPVGLRNLGPCKFKKTISTQESDLAIGRTLATRVAQLASSGAPDPTVPFLSSASQIRNLILRAGAPWVGLSHLVDYCWAAGLPVLHLSAFPPGNKKMDGLAWVEDGRRAVVLSKNIPYSAWLLFILAHEVGHIAKGHVGRGGALVDEEVDRRSTDEEERAANAFALELLTGSPETQVFAVGAKATPHALLKAAHQAGTEQQIDPGHLVLNWAYQAGGKSFAIANAALEMLEPALDAPGITVDGQLILYRYLFANLDKTKVPEETYEFIRRVTMPEDRL